MGYFDGLVSGSFKRDEAGQVVFFPYGVLGSGKLAPSEEAADALKFGLKIYFIAALPVIVVLGVLSGFLATMAAAVVMIGLYELWMRRKTAGWLNSNERLSYTESTRNSARAAGMITLIVLLLCSLAFVVAGIAMAITMPEARLTGILSTLFFGACSAVFIFMLRLRRVA